MSQPPHQHQHQHQHHPDDYKSSSSSSTSSSTDAITSTLAQLELEQERFHYPSSQYAYLSNDVTTRSMGVAAFTEPPVFRSTDVSNLNKDEYHNTWQTSSTGAKDLNLSSGYSRETDAQHLDPKSHSTSYTTSSTSSSSSSSSTTLSRDDELRQSLRDMIPLDNPGYVEACYHFKFTMSPVEMYITLLKILDQLRVDTSIPDIKQYKIICRSYHDGTAIPFIVRIWKPVRDDNNTVNTEYWCEFQRRSGDILYFSELYHQCVKAVSTGNIESACIPPRTILPGIDDVVASPDEMAETLKCFMQMAASPCNDIKTQGILALSELSSQNDTTRDLMIQHGGLETFLKSLMNTSEDVQRGATTGLANLAQGTHADRVASTFTADASRLARLSYNANASQQLVRESARALYNIGMALGASRCDATFRNTVKSFHATDPQAKQHIHRLVTQLQIC